MRRLGMRVQEEKANIIKEAMDTFARVTNLEQLNIPLHERFKAASYSYEVKAEAQERELWEQKFEARKGYLDLGKLKEQFYETSRLWHQTAELLRNASEFAATPKEQNNDLSTSHYMDGLGYLNASLAPVILNQVCPVENLKKIDEIESYGVQVRAGIYDSVDLQRALSATEILLRVAEASFKIKREDSVNTFRSALNSVESFIEAYNVSGERRYLSYALTCKLLVYTSLTERMRYESVVDGQIINEMRGTLGLMEEAERHLRTERSIIGSFAVFALDMFHFYLSGLERELGMVKYPIYFSMEKLKTKNVLCEHPIWLEGPWITGLVDGMRSMHGEDLKKARLRFRWVLGSIKTGVFSSEEGIFLTLTMPYLRTDIKMFAGYVKNNLLLTGVLRPSGFFNTFSRYFALISRDPNITVNYLGGGYEHEIRPIPIEVEAKKIESASVGMDVKTFLNVCDALHQLLSGINHPSIDEYKEQIRYSKTWRDWIQQLEDKRGSFPKVTQPNRTELTKEAVNHDLSHLSISIDLFDELPHPPERVSQILSWKKELDAGTRLGYTQDFIDGSEHLTIAIAIGLNEKYFAEEEVIYNRMMEDGKVEEFWLSRGL